MVQEKSTDTERMLAGRNPSSLSGPLVSRCPGKFQLCYQIIQSFKVVFHARPRRLLVHASIEILSSFHSNGKNAAGVYKTCCSADVSCNMCVIVAAHHDC